MKGELSLEKRCIWNWDHGKKIEYLEEKGKKAKFETIFGIEIASVAGIFFGVLPLVVIFYYIFEIVLQGPSVIQEQIINIVIIIPFWGMWICAVLVQIYACMVSDGRYYLNEKGIQIEYYFHIHREICWKDIDILKEEQCLLIREKERKLVSAIYFLFAKKVVLKKKKRKKNEE